MANTPSFSNYIIHPLRNKQEIVLDAMDRLQIDMLEPARLYSTFPGIQYSAIPPDTQLEISAADFKKAVQLFVKGYKVNTRGYHLKKERSPKRPNLLIYSDPFRSAPRSFAPNSETNTPLHLRAALFFFGTTLKLTPSGSKKENPQLSLRVIRLLVTPSGFKPETF